MLIPPLDAQLDIPAGDRWPVSDQNRAITALDLFSSYSAVRVTSAGLTSECDAESVPEGGETETEKYVV